MFGLKSVKFFNGKCIFNFVYFYFYVFDVILINEKIMLWDFSGNK